MRRYEIKLTLPALGISRRGEAKAAGLNSRLNLKCETAVGI